MVATQVPPAFWTWMFTVLNYIVHQKAEQKWFPVVLIDQRCTKQRRNVTFAASANGTCKLVGMVQISFVSLPCSKAAVQFFQDKNYPNFARFFHGLYQHMIRYILSKIWLKKNRATKTNGKHIMLWCGGGPGPTMSNPAAVRLPASNPSTTRSHAATTTVSRVCWRLASAWEFWCSSSRLGLRFLELGWGWCTRWVRDSWSLRDHVLKVRIWISSAKLRSRSRKIGPCKMKQIGNLGHLNSGPLGWMAKDAVIAGATNLELGSGANAAACYGATCKALQCEWLLLIPSYLFKPCLHKWWFQCGLNQCLWRIFWLVSE